MRHYTDFDWNLKKKNKQILGICSSHNQNTEFPSTLTRRITMAATAPDEIRSSTYFTIQINLYFPPVPMRNTNISNKFHLCYFTCLAVYCRLSIDIPTTRFMIDSIRLESLQRNMDDVAKLAWWSEYNITHAHKMRIQMMDQFGLLFIYIQ